MMDQQGTALHGWRIAVAGLFMQMALGAVYAWSVFRTPVAAQFGWSIPEVTLTFTISSPAHLTIAAFLILTCYGGGFGTMPALAADYFGAANSGSIYRLMLTVLADFTQAVPVALAQASAEEARPPGLLKLLSTFFKKDFRRGLAAMNDLVVAFGRNVSSVEKR